MSSRLFKQFIRKSLLSKQGPPGPPPRRGLVWKPTTHRWIRPIDAVHQEIKENVAEGNTDLVDDITPEEVQEAYDSVADQFDDGGDFDEDFVRFDYSKLSTKEILAKIKDGATDVPEGYSVDRTAYTIDDYVDDEFPNEHKKFNVKKLIHKYPDGEYQSSPDGGFKVTFHGKAKDVQAYAEAVEEHFNSDLIDPVHEEDEDQLDTEPDDRLPGESHAGFLKRYFDGEARKKASNMPHNELLFRMIRDDLGNKVVLDGPEKFKNAEEYADYLGDEAMKNNIRENTS